MKLRVRGNSIRLRLTQPEVADLVARGRVDEAVLFGGGVRFGYALVCSDEAKVLGSRFVDGVVEVTVPSSVARAWAESEQVGLEAEQSMEGAAPLRLLVEKDWACLKPRAGEDDADAFANPNKAC